MGVQDCKSAVSESSDFGTFGSVKQQRLLQACANGQSCQSLCCSYTQIMEYSKTHVKWPPSKKPKIVFQDQLSLNAGQNLSIADCSKGSILQYFQPSLSYHLSLRSVFCLFLSGRFTPVLHWFYCNRN